MQAEDFLVRLTPKISFSPEPNSVFSLSLGITPRTHAPEEILQLAEDIAVKRNKHIVVCIDEFQQVGQMPDSVTIQKRLRSIWQHQKNVSYCLFGSRKHLMAGIFEKRNMPFYQFGDMIHLDKIKTEDWVNYIVSHFEDRNKHISSELANSICSTVSNYSSYVQQLAWLLFCQVEPGESATENQLKIAVDDLLNSNESLFMQQVEALTGYQMNFLRAIVAGIHTKFGVQTIRENFDLGSPSNVARLRNALIEKDLVESREHGQLYITDPVFELWFRTKMMH